MQIERSASDALVVNQLPDGSKFIFDPSRETAFALNTTAGAAWDACNGPTTLSKVASDMSHSLHTEISDEVAGEAIQQLQAQNLVAATGARPLATRRQVLGALGAVALPLVVSLSVSQQQAHATAAKSGGSTQPPPDCNLVCQILKGLGL